MSRYFHNSAQYSPANDTLDSNQLFGLSSQQHDDVKIIIPTTPRLTQTASEQPSFDSDSDTYWYPTPQNVRTSLDPQNKPTTLPKCNNSSDCGSLDSAIQGETCDPNNRNTPHPINQIPTPFPQQSANIDHPRRYSLSNSVTTPDLPYTSSQFSHPSRSNQLPSEPAVCPSQSVLNAGYSLLFQMYPKPKQFFIFLTIFLLSVLSTLPLTTFISINYLAQINPVVFDDPYYKVLYTTISLSFYQLTIFPIHPFLRYNRTPTVIILILLLIPSYILHWAVSFYGNSRITPCLVQGLISILSSGVSMLNLSYCISYAHFLKGFGILVDKAGNDNNKAHANGTTNVDDSDEIGENNPGHTPRPPHPTNHYSSIISLTSFGSIALSASMTMIFLAYILDWGFKQGQSTLSKIFLLPAIFALCTALYLLFYFLPGTPPIPLHSGDIDVPTSQSVSLGADTISSVNSDNDHNTTFHHQHHQHHQQQHHQKSSSRDQRDANRCAGFVDDQPEKQARQSLLNPTHQDSSSPHPRSEYNHQFSHNGTASEHQTPCSLYSTPYHYFTTIISNTKHYILTFNHLIWTMNSLDDMSFAFVDTTSGFDSKKDNSHSSENQGGNHYSPSLHSDPKPTKHIPSLLVKDFFIYLYYLVMAPFLTIEQRVELALPPVDTTPGPNNYPGINNDTTQPPTTTTPQPISTSATNFNRNFNPEIDPGSPTVYSGIKPQSDPNNNIDTEYIDETSERLHNSDRPQTSHQDNLRFLLAQQRLMIYNRSIVNSLLSPTTLRSAQPELFLHFNLQTDHMCDGNFNPVVENDSSFENTHAKTLSSNNNSNNIDSLQSSDQYSGDDNLKRIDQSANQTKANEAIKNKFQGRRAKPNTNCSTQPSSPSSNNWTIFPSFPQSRLIFVLFFLVQGLVMGGIILFSTSFTQAIPLIFPAVAGKGMRIITMPAVTEPQNIESKVVSSLSNDHAHHHQLSFVTLHLSNLEDVIPIHSDDNDDLGNNTDVTNSHTNINQKIIGSNGGDIIPLPEDQTDITIDTLVDTPTATVINEIPSPDSNTPAIIITDAVITDKAIDEIIFLKESQNIEHWIILWSLLFGTGSVISMLLQHYIVFYNKKQSEKLFASCCGDGRGLYAGDDDAKYSNRHISQRNGDSPIVRIEGLEPNEGLYINNITFATATPHLPSSRKIPVIPAPLSKSHHPLSFDRNPTVNNALEPTSDDPSLQIDQSDSILRNDETSDDQENPIIGPNTDQTHRLINVFYRNRYQKERMRYIERLNRYNNNVPFSKFFKKAFKSFKRGVFVSGISSALASMGLNGNNINQNNKHNPSGNCPHPSCRGESCGNISPDDNNSTLTDLDALDGNDNSSGLCIANPKSSISSDCCSDKTLNTSCFNGVNPHPALDRTQHCCDWGQDDCHDCINGECNNCDWCGDIITRTSSEGCCPNGCPSSISTSSRNASLTIFTNDEPLTHHNHTCHHNHEHGTDYLISASTGLSLPQLLTMLPALSNLKILQKLIWWHLVIIVITFFLYTITFPLAFTHWTGHMGQLSSTHYDSSPSSRLIPLQSSGTGLTTLLPKITLPLALITLGFTSSSLSSLLSLLLEVFAKPTIFLSLYTYTQVITVSVSVIIPILTHTWTPNGISAMNASSATKGQRHSTLATNPPIATTLDHPFPIERDNISTLSTEQKIHFSPLELIPRPETILITPNLDQDGHYRDHLEYLSESFDFLSRLNAMISGALLLAIGLFFIFARSIQAHSPLILAINALEAAAVEMPLRQNKAREQ